jgi:hypothetical protein
MDCRHISAEEVKEIIRNGRINYQKIVQNSQGTSYPLEGVTADGQEVRVVVSPHGNTLVIVTVIDTEKEWSCDCN